MENIIEIAKVKEILLNNAQIWREQEQKAKQKAETLDILPQDRRNAWNTGDQYRARKQAVLLVAEEMELITEEEYQEEMAR